MVWVEVLKIANLKLGDNNENNPPSISGSLLHNCLGGIFGLLLKYWIIYRKLKRAKDATILGMARKL